MVGPSARATVATLLAVVVASGAAPSGQPRSAIPVVAIVLTDGKLLPFAAKASGAWQTLPWPRHEFQEAQPSPFIPANPGSIPREWFAPLAALPSTWRLQPINGKGVAIHTMSPTRWQIATFDTVGFTTDYLDPDPKQRVYDFNAGIAVSGDVDALVVRELDESSSDWAHIVARHVKAFIGADHADARRRGTRMKGRTSAIATKELRAGDVSLYRVELDPKHAYQYFEATVQRAVDADPKRQNCAAPSVAYYGMIEQKGRTETVRWLSVDPPSCSDPAEVMEVVGGLRGTDGVRLIVEYSGDDWQSFGIVNPAAPEALVRRPAGSPGRGTLLH